MSRSGQAPCLPACQVTVLTSRGEPIPRRLLLLALPLSLASPAAAEARATATVSQVSQTATPGGKVSVSVGLLGVRSCTLRAGRARHLARTAGATQVRFGFRVHRRARAGRHVVRIGCAPAATTQVRVTVRRTAANRRGAGQSLITGSVSSRVIRPAAAAPAPGAAPGASAPGASAPAPSAPGTPTGAMTPERAAAEADAWWPRVRAAKDRRWRNGQCTDWAQSKRPDIVERVEKHVMAQLLLHPGTPFEPLSWVGADWDDNARRAGLEVVLTPRTGAIAVQERGVDGAGASSGHVSYVEEVLPDGRFRVSEMHSPVLGQVTTSVRRAGPGWSFIP